jgi:hypothetical protein
MHGLDTLMRLNAEFGQPELPGKRLRHHPRIAALRTYVKGLPVDENYRCWLYRSINLYADQIVTRPVYAPEEGWDDLEALQQVTLGDMNEHHFARRFRNRQGGLS